MANLPAKNRVSFTVCNRIFRTFFVNFEQPTSLRYQWTLIWRGEKWAHSALTVANFSVEGIQLSQ